VGGQAEGDGARKQQGRQGMACKHECAPFNG